MGNFNILLFVLSLGICTFSVDADVTATKPGVIGIAIVRAKDPNLFAVEYVAANGPAATAGIKTGDCLAAIDGVSTRAMSLTTAQRSLRGDVGSLAKLTVRREGSVEIQVFVLRLSFVDAYSPAATGGDPRAENALGHFYEHSPDPARDPIRAMEWYRRAADQNYAAAEVKLAAMYWDGRGVSKDPAIAAAWALKAAKQGNAYGESTLGECYLKGYGVHQSLRDAFAWLYSAARQGDAFGEAELGECYLWGYGVRESDQDAFAWLYGAARQGNAYAEARLGECYLWGKGLRQSYREAFAWLYSAAVQGDASSEATIGWCYLQGQGVRQSDRDGFAWYYSAAVQGDASSEATIGGCYLRGQGVRQSDRDGFAWLYSAAVQGNAYAEATLGYCYLQGNAVRQNNKDAFYWLYNAARQDDPASETRLASLYRNGLGVARNDREAFDWYYRSAQLREPYGEWGLAHMYRDGLGAPKNIGEALKWYQKAAADLPQDEQLKKAVVHARISAFLEDPDYGTLDLPLITSIYERQILLISLVLALIYFAGGAVLFHFTLKAPDVPSRLPVALGWLAFYSEGQLAGGFAVFLFWKLLTVDKLILLSSLFSALPLILSTCGPLRSHIWKTSQASWKKLLLYAAVSCLAIFIVDIGYDRLYEAITHSSLAPQSTQLLIIRIKRVSAWAAYACAAVLAPAAEEIMFRGYLFDALRRRYSGKVVVVITAFVFALIHFQWLHFVPLFGFGLVAGWLKLKTNSLRLPLLLHAINNGLSVALAA